MMNEPAKTPRRSTLAPDAAAPTGDHRLHVLVVEDSDDDTALLVRQLRQGGYQPVWQRVETPAAMNVALDEKQWDVVICDHGLPHFSAPGALKLLRDKGLDLPFIIVSATMGEELAVKAMKEGASDYLMKGNLARLVPAVGRELRETLVRQERRQAQEAQREQAHVSAALARLGQELIAALGTPALLDCLCRVTVQVLRCDLSYTLLRRPQQDAFVFTAGYGTTPDEHEAGRALKLPVRALSTWLSAVEREEVLDSPAVLLDSLAAARQGPAASARQLCMALRRGADLIGLHIASCRNRTAPFSPLQRQIAHGIAQLGSMAVQHQQVVAELERANHLKSDFVATMSHELRTPLNAIMGYNQLLLDQEFGALAPEQIETLRRMDRSSRQLLDLVNATLDLNRLDAGRMPLALEQVRVADVMTTLDSETRELALRPTLHLVWDVPPDLPPLYTDAAKLKVILKNLIGNALKFTECGSIAVAARRHDGGVEFSVSDTGIGIAPDNVPIIFEPFRQLESALTRRYGGVGLGLYIVRRLLELLGGAISIDSELGRGSTFRVWLPADARAPSVTPMLRRYAGQQFSRPPTPTGG